MLPYYLLGERLVGARDHLFGRAVLDVGSFAVSRFGTIDFAREKLPNNGLLHVT